MAISSPYKYVLREKTSGLKPPLYHVMAVHLSSLTQFLYLENGVDGGDNSLPTFILGYYVEFCKSSALCMKANMLHLFFRPDFL